jgi:hypothetical protein
MTLHTSTYKGKRILIILNDGTKLVGKFKEKKSGAVYTEEHGRISTSNMKAMTIFKPSDEFPPQAQ